MFQTQPVQTKEFYDMDSLRAYTQYEKQNISNINLEDLGDIQIVDDTYLQTATNRFHFNDMGIQSVISSFTPSGSYEFLKAIPEAGLASEALNSFLKNPEIKKTLDRKAIVVDNATGEILGAVSANTDDQVGYQTLYNDDFVTHLGGQDMTFEKASVTNTLLRFNMLSKKNMGRVTGSGGNGSDMYMRGAEGSNSLLGNLSARFSAYLKRMICNNGMLATVLSDANRVVHRGGDFTVRLDEALASAINSFSRIEETINAVGGIEYKPEQLVMLNAPLDDVLAPIRDNLALYPRPYYKNGKNFKTVEAELASRDNTVKFIESIPYLLGGETSKAVFTSTYRDNASVWDFGNVINEHAKTLESNKQRQMEENAFTLINWASTKLVS